MGRSWTSDVQGARWVVEVTRNWDIRWYGACLYILGSGILIGNLADL